MRNSKWRIFAACLCLQGLTASADDLGGARWTAPTQLTESDGYTMACLDACRTYRVGEAGAFPVIIVHSPSLQTEDVTRRWQALRGNEQDQNLLEVLHEENRIGTGTLTTRVFKGTARNTGFDTFYMLSLWQAPGVAVPIETMSMNSDDLISASSAHLELASTMAVDVAAIRTAEAAMRTLLATRIKAVRDGYARGDKARVYAATTLQTVYGLNMTPIADGTSINTVMSSTQSSVEVEHLVVLLPGGVLLTERPGDPKNPDLAGASGRKSIGAWQEDSRVVFVTWPDGHKSELRKTGDSELSDADLTYTASAF